MKGTLEILQMADGQQPKSFNDFMKITIKRKISSATVSKRITELIEVDAIKQIMVKSASGRRTIAYKTTEKGKKVIEQAIELEKTLRESKEG